MAPPAEMRRFRYAELEAATGGFVQSAQLGAGGFGEVYRGTLPGGADVAVKRIMESVARRGSEDNVIAMFLREARLMDTAAKDAVAGGRSHLLPLLGMCWDDVAQLCLVMPFMAGGSVADHIGSPGGKLATGRQRMAVALAAARGVAALHSRRPRMLHRDIKPENVLLDSELRAYVADYGLSRVVTGDDSKSVVSKLYGTLGYHAPETLASGSYSAKARGG